MHVAAIFFIIPTYFHRLLIILTHIHSGLPQNDWTNDVSWALLCGKLVSKQAESITSRVRRIYKTSSS